MRKQTPHLLIFGAGYTAKYIADKALQNGWRVTMTSRTPNLTYQGVDILPFGADLPNDTTFLLSTVPPKDGQDPVLTAYNGQWPQSTQWFGYLSSTGVYGDTNGKTVTEKSPLLGTSPQAQARIGAEQGWLSLEQPVHIFRLTGIYGPKRNMLERLKQENTHKLEHSNRPVNRIHVDDIATAIMASIALPSHKSIVYNVSDDCPAPTKDIVAFAANLLGITIPEAAPQDVSHLHDGSRVVNCDLIKKSLGVLWKYPDYKTGLKALLNK